MKRRTLLITAIIIGFIVGLAVFIADCHINPGNMTESITAGCVLCILTTIAVILIGFLRSVAPKKR